ncbi:hypothetical protein NESM_000694900 [Novymonas esmeraldas]|uniref:Uncharacterized protein n=1 Tax=Novymonas esmeraldas TaxID=1808958 RepID=A0AAW0ET86_9TRYP
MVHLAAVLAHRRHDVVGRDDRHDVLVDRAQGEVELAPRQRDARRAERHRLHPHLRRHNRGHGAAERVPGEHQLPRVLRPGPNVGDVVVEVRKEVAAEVVLLAPPQAVVAAARQLRPRLVHITAPVRRQRRRPQQVHHQVLGHHHRTRDQHRHQLVQHHLKKDIRVEEEVREGEHVRATHRDDRHVSPLAVHLVKVTPPRRLVVRVARHARRAVAPLYHPVRVQVRIQKAQHRRELLHVEQVRRHREQRQLPHRRRAVLPRAQLRVEVLALGRRDVVPHERARRRLRHAGEVALQRRVGRVRRRRAPRRVLRQQVHPQHNVVKREAAVVRRRRHPHRQRTQLRERRLHNQPRHEQRVQHQHRHGDQAQHHTHRAKLGAAEVAGTLQRQQPRKRVGVEVVVEHVAPQRAGRDHNLPPQLHLSPTRVHDRHAPNVDQHVETHHIRPVVLLLVPILQHARQRRRQRRTRVGVLPHHRPIRRHVELARQVDGARRQQHIHRHQHETQQHVVAEVEQRTHEQQLVRRRNDGDWKHRVGVPQQPRVGAQCARHGGGDREGHVAEQVWRVQVRQDHHTGREAEHRATRHRKADRKHNHHKEANVPHGVDVVAPPVVLHVRDEHLRRRRTDELARRLHRGRHRPPRRGQGRRPRRRVRNRDGSATPSCASRAAAHLRRLRHRHAAVRGREGALHRQQERRRERVGERVQVVAQSRLQLAALLVEAAEEAPAVQRRVLQRHLAQHRRQDKDDLDRKHAPRRGRHPRLAARPLHYSVRVAEQPQPHGKRHRDDTADSQTRRLLHRKTQPRAQKGVVELALCRVGVHHRLRHAVHHLVPHGGDGDGERSEGRHARRNGAEPVHERRHTRGAERPQLHLLRHRDHQHPDNALNRCVRQRHNHRKEWNVVDAEEEADEGVQVERELIWEVQGAHGEVHKLASGPQTLLHVPVPHGGKRACALRRIMQCLAQRRLVCRRRRTRRQRRSAALRALTLHPTLRRGEQERGEERRGGCGAAQWTTPHYTTKNNNNNDQQQRTKVNNTNQSPHTHTHTHKHTLARHTVSLFLSRVRGGLAHSPTQARTLRGGRRGRRRPTGKAATTTTAAAAAADNSRERE